MGRSRGGLTSKIHAVVDTNWLPVQLALTAVPGVKGDLSPHQKLAFKLEMAPRNAKSPEADATYQFVSIFPAEGFPECRLGQ
jgi:hypothetical protein